MDDIIFLNETKGERHCNLYIIGLSGQEPLGFGWDGLPAFQEPLPPRIRSMQNIPL